MTDQTNIEQQIKSLQNQLKDIKNDKAAKQRNLKAINTVFWRSKNENIVFLRNELLEHLEQEYKATIKQTIFSKLKMPDYFKLKGRLEELKDKQSKLWAEIDKLENREWRLANRCGQYENFQISLRRLLNKTKNSEIIEKWETGLLAMKLIQDKK